MTENKQTLAFEIGTEEIPAFDLVSATKQLEKNVQELLAEARVSYSSVQVYSTPRRLVVIVEGILPETEALVEEHKGPSVAIAFDAEGNATKAAIGFARGKDLDVADLERRVVDGNEYVFALQRKEALPVSSILPGILQKIIESISWPKSMRWSTKSELFSRPVRWLLALLDEDIIPVQYADLHSGRVTWGHRFMASGPHAVASASELPYTLEQAYVIVDQDKREKLIRDGVLAIETQTGLSAELPPKTLTEVINLTEYPTPLMGTFDEEFLKVPEEIIIDALLMHQRYFPLYDDDKKLSNRFIAVSNGNPSFAEIIIDGNQRVVRPRLSDAKFFYEEDLKHPLEYYVDHLDKVVFQESLGTMKDKTERIISLVDHLSKDIDLSETAAHDAHRAAYLCKADLVSNAVVEFTSVQGIMGSYYAKAAGETDQVAQAIADQYRPRFAGDEAPRTVVGKIVAMADKLDTICGLFAVGQGPTGSSDPFALRRSAIGIINMLTDGLAVSLIPAIRASLSTFGMIDFDQLKVENEIVDFFITRTKVMLRDNDMPADVVDAVLASGVKEPALVVLRVEALVSAREDMTETMDDLAIAYARANNLRDSSLGTVIDESIMGEAELDLVAAIAKVETGVDAALLNSDYAQALVELAQLRAPIDRFFEEILIMDENLQIKENRIKLLNRFVTVFSQVADFGKMAKVGK